MDVVFLACICICMHMGVAMCFFREKEDEGPGMIVPGRMIGPGDF